MKIQQLELVAFGRFKNTHLNFHQAPNFNVIYGANETGKSTTLRALNALFFGFPERTTDAFLHNNDQLRVGAQLLNGSAEVLYCYRRKGRKNTLLDPKNQPLDENLMQTLLGGLTETQFNALFSIDHSRLVQGGEDLLSGGGDVGETLFEAGSGTFKLHQVLNDLDKEAADLFKARASKPKLNQTIKAYKEASQRMKNASLPANKWKEHATRLEDSYTKHAQLTEQLNELRTRQHFLARIQRTRPLLQRRQTLIEQLLPLKNTFILPDDAKTQRIEATLAINTAQSQIQQSQNIIKDLQAQHQTIQIPHQLLGQKEAIDNLRERLGSHLKAARDLPGVRTEMRTVENEAQLLLKKIYPQHDSAQLDPLIITNPQREKIKQLADQYPALREKNYSIEERLEKLNQQILQYQKQLDSTPPPPDLTMLKTALNRALRQGELEENLTKDDRETTQMMNKAEIALKQLGLWSGSLESLEQLPLPGLKRIESFEAKFKELDNDRQRIKERLIEARQRYGQATQKIEALRWAGEVPTESDLQQIRQRRQQHWQTIKHAQASTDNYRNFEEAMLRADDIADRLRREASRVAEQANLIAEQHSAQREQESQTKKWHAVNELITNLQTEWEAVWQETEIKPWSPTEMRSWLNECLALRQQISLLREKRQQLEARQQLIAELCHEISQAFAQLPNTTLPLTRLSDLIEQAQTSVEHFTNIQRQREDLEKQIKSLQIEQQRWQTNYSQNQQALTDWQTDWQKALAPLQLPADTSPETARNVLDVLDQIINKQDKINGLKRRIERMEEDAEVFREDVKTLAQTIAPELLTLKTEEIVPQLSTYLSQAEKNSTRYEEIQQRIIAEEREFNQAQIQLQKNQAWLNSLLEQAHCADLTQLEQAEVQSENKKSLQQQLQAIEQQLLELGEGMSLEELAAAAETVDINQLPAQLDNLTEQITAIEQERSVLDQTIGELRTLLKQMDGNDAAAQAADEVQLTLAEMQNLSERYMQVTLAASMLRRSIERYREQHQAPLLQRASELFQKLTLGRFSGLKTGYSSNNDQPIILGLRDKDSLGITTSAMSDGTRDQLYLALRLASIEQYLAKNLILPLILDDVLINFDDDRAQATLTVIAELSEKTQILFFTHHARLVELVEKYVTPTTFKIHEL